MIPARAGRLRVPLAGALLLLGAGCVSLPPAPPSDPCFTLFTSQDAAIAAAGLIDGGPRRVPGFPYLRSNRLLASFRDELAGEAAFAAWTESMRQLDLEARLLELHNLHGVPPPAALRERLLDCGRQLSAAHASQHRQRLIQLARVPDDYSLAARTLGLYPLAAPLLKVGIHRYQNAVDARFTEPLAADPASADRILWLPETDALLSHAEAAALAASAPRDALGIPRPDAGQLARLFDRHAPAFWIETRGAADHLGTPVPQGPGVDREQPQLYVEAGHTRFRGEVLLQLSYTVWFDERPRRGWLDSYAGRLDGLVWRVTLGSDGQPLLYDSIHPCGCYHTLFPLSGQALKARTPWWRESPSLPQGAIPWWELAVAVQADTHYIERILPLSALRGAERRALLPLAPYNALRSLPAPGGRRSLFGADGLVAGSERGERWWLWPSGVRSPGAMRQSGRQATAFVGRRHFDDPFLLEQLFH